MKCFQILCLTATLFASKIVVAQSLVNQPAPPLQLKTILQGGDNPGIVKLAGKYIVLEFWATWCTPCVRNIPHLNELAERFEGKNVQFVSVTDEPKEKIQAFLGNRKMKGWVAIDNGNKTHDNYRVKGLPETFIVNTEGIIVYQGEPSDLTEELLDAVVSGTYTPTAEPGVSNAERFGGWGGGQDPVITANFDMDTMNYLHHEFIRRSVYPYPGSGWRQGNGEVGVTILGMGMSEIFAIIYDLPSSARVLNKSKTGNASKWDILFSRKAGYDLEKGMAAVEGILRNTFSINVSDESISKDIWVADYSKAEKLIPAAHVADDDPNLRTYQLLSDVCATMEKKIGLIVDYTVEAKQQYVDIFELGNAYYTMSGEELKKWLEDKQGVIFKTENRNLKIKVIYDK